MRILRYIKNIFEDDFNEDYWDKKATNLKYHKKLNNGETRKDFFIPKNNDELFKTAHEKVGLVDFNKELDKLAIEKMFYSLDDEKIKMALGIGIVGAIFAFITEAQGKALENKIDESANKYFGKDFDKYNPADSKRGNNHRYHYGHDPVRDIFTGGQKLPEGYRLPNGKEIQKNVQRLYQLFNKKYYKDINGNLIVQPLDIFSHLLIHYLKDFVTVQGLPIPFSSHFTEWEENMLNTCGFSSRNKFMDALGREYGSFNFSDITSVGLIKILKSIYSRKIITNNKIDRTSKNAEKILRNQLSVISYGTCIFIQMSLIFKSKKIDTKSKDVLYGAKLNLILVSLFLKNFSQLFMSLNKEHKNILLYYDKSIDKLENKSFEEWREWL